MSILYLCVCKDGNIVNEYPSGQKNMKETIKYKILPLLAPQDYKDKTEQDRIRYNWEQTRRGVTFICVTTKDFNLVATFGCISSMKNEYLQAERSQNLGSMSITLSNLKKMWMQPGDHNKLLKAEQEAQVVKSKMIQNVEKIMTNLDKIEEIKDNSASLAQNARTFKKKSSDFASGMMKVNIIMWIILIVTVLIVIFLGIWVGCKFPDFSRCRISDGSGSGSGSGSTTK